MSSELKKRYSHQKRYSLKSKGEKHQVAQNQTQRVGDISTGK